MKKMFLSLVLALTTASPAPAELLAEPAIDLLDSPLPAWINPLMASWPSNGCARCPTRPLTPEASR